MRLRLLLLVVPVFVMGAAPATRPSSTQPADVGEAMKHATAVALVEVTDVTERDERPADGNDVQIVRLKILRSSGQAADELRVVVAYGGMRAGPTPEPGGPLYPDPLVKGGRYYLLYAAKEEWRSYPQGVVAWWPEQGAPVAVLEEAIRSSRYREK